jgi:hypothetical protein
MMDVQNAIAVTSCVETSKGKYEAYSIINMTYLDSADVLGEVRAHEAVHIRQYAADPTLCRDYLAAFNAKPDKAFERAQAKWLPRVLQMELAAYCETAPLRMKQLNETAEVVYFNYLNRLTSQFSRYLPRELVTAAWFTACGKLLG